MSIIENIYTNQKLYLISLVFLFIVSFAAPLLFAFTIGGLLSEYMPESVVTLDHQEAAEHSADQDSLDKDSLFPEAVGISGSNAIISVKSDPSLEPSEGKDFIISIWVKFKKLPLADENYIIFSKYDDKSASRKGYSLSVALEQEIIRPSVYWRDEHNNGTWFTFSEIHLEPRQWNLFVISFRENKYLGLHTAALTEVDDKLSTQIKLLGGYELSNKIIPQNKSDLEIGAVSSGRFRGKIGPVGIFSRQSLTEKLDLILSKLVENPLEIPDLFERQDVGLWFADGVSDTSQNKNKVTVSKGRKD